MNHLKGQPLVLEQDNQLPALDAQYLFNTPVRLKAFTVATLPAAPTTPAPVQGDCYLVTDATAPTFLGTLTGGGTVVTPVFFDGTVWRSF